MGVTWVTCFVLNIRMPGNSPLAFCWRVAFFSVVHPKCVFSFFPFKLMGGSHTGALTMYHTRVTAVIVDIFWPWYPSIAKVWPWSVATASSYKCLRWPTRSAFNTEVFHELCGFTVLANPPSCWILLFAEQRHLLVESRILKSAVFHTLLLELSLELKGWQTSSFSSSFSCAC